MDQLMEGKVAVQSRKGITVNIHIAYDNDKFKQIGSKIFREWQHPQPADISEMQSSGECKDWLSTAILNSNLLNGTAHYSIKFQIEMSEIIYPKFCGTHKNQTSVDVALSLVFEIPFLQHLKPL